MDNFINLAKQGMQAYQNSNNEGQQHQGQGQGQGQGGFGGGFGGQQGGFGGQQGGFGGQQFGVGGGEQFNAPHGSGGPGGFGGFGRKHSSYPLPPLFLISQPCTIVDSGAAVGTAQQYLGNQGQSSQDSGLSGLFAQGLAMAQSYGVNKNPQDVDLDGDGIIDAHERAYGQQQAQGGKMDAQSMGAAAAMQAMKSFMGQGGGQAQQSSGGNMQSKVGPLGRLFHPYHINQTLSHHRSSEWQWPKPSR